MGYKVVVAGATGNVGREMLNILSERGFPADEVAVLASRRSLGTEVSFGDKTLKTEDLDTFDFTGWDMALFAIGGEATKQYAPKAAKARRSLSPDQRVHEKLTLPQPRKFAGEQRRLIEATFSEALPV